MIESPNVLVDCDGVLLTSNAKFSEFIFRKTGVECPQDEVATKYPIQWSFFEGDKLKCNEFIAEFQTTSLFANCDPMPGAVNGVKRLVDHGCVLTIVSSMVTSEASRENRLKNIASVFGDAFKPENIILLDLGASKYHTLKKFKLPRYFIEDSIISARDGLAHHWPVTLKSPYNETTLNNAFREKLRGMIIHDSWEKVVNYILVRCGIPLQPVTDCRC